MQVSFSDGSNLHGAHDQNSVNLNVRALCSEFAVKFDKKGVQQIGARIYDPPRATKLNHCNWALCHDEGVGVTLQAALQHGVHGATVRRPGLLQVAPICGAYGRRSPVTDGSQ